jgi:hypothetical protein
MNEEENEDEDLEEVYQDAYLVIEEEPFKLFKIINDRLPYREFS